MQVRQAECAAIAIEGLPNSLLPAIIVKLESGWQNANQLLIEIRYNIWLNEFSRHYAKAPDNGPNGGYPVRSDLASQPVKHV